MWCYIVARVMIAVVNKGGDKPTLEFVNNFMDEATDRTSQKLREGDRNYHINLVIYYKFIVHHQCQL